MTSKIWVKSPCFRAWFLLNFALIKRRDASINAGIRLLIKKQNMRVFVTGATGFIGSAIVQDLINAGHQVLGLARSDEAASALTAAGAEVHRGTIEDLDSLKRGAAASDGVIHTAYIHDFSNIAASGVKDKLAVEALGTALIDSGRPLVVTSGIAALPAGRLGKETDTPDPLSPGKHRIPSEEVVAAMALRGVRSSVVRLPPSVHGDSDRHGFVPALIAIARQKGISAYVGDGLNRWPAVHLLDAARVFRLAMEKGVAGSTFHAVGDEGVPTRDIAEMIGRRLQLPVVAKSATEAADHFGWLGHFFAIDCAASSALTQEQLGWRPGHPGLIADLEKDSYFQN
jgi:nucleoside-diphosphate-sugar epimerase